jgi:ribosome biogenesis GTPase A
MDAINWFPGHMVKARKMVKENLKLVDVVIELLDARIPMSSRNPDIDTILENIPRVVVLNKADLADNLMTDKWVAYFQEELGRTCIKIDSRQGTGINNLLNAVQKKAVDILAKLTAKGRRPRPIRVMMVGIPNVGKSSLINKITGKGSAKTGDTPGLTRGKQWIRVGKGVEMLDTPGILWPKFEDPEVGFRLAVTGAIKDEVINIEQVTVRLIHWLSEMSPENLKSRYKLDALETDSFETLKKIGSKRGCLVSGGNVDTFKAAVLVLNEFRSGKIGLYTLDNCETTK